MFNNKFIIRLALGLMLSLIILVGSAFSYDKVDCHATSPGPVVNLYEKPYTTSAIVNHLTVDDSYFVVDIRKVPSELEPEGAHVLWLFLVPPNKSRAGWVLSNNVIISGTECNKFGL